MKKRLINTAKNIYKAFKQKPILTIYSLLLSPVYFGLIAITALVAMLINLDFESGVDFWNENT